MMLFCVGIPTWKKSGTDLTETTIVEDSWGMLDMVIQAPFMDIVIGRKGASCIRDPPLVTSPHRGGMPKNMDMDF